MPTNPSAKTKSPHGSSGRDEAPDQMVVDSETYQEAVAVSGSPDIQMPEATPAPVSASEQEDAAPADGSGNTGARETAMSETDRKLATRMTRAISDRLGLSGRTRSVRV